MINVKWDDTKPQIIIWEFTAPWDFDEFYTAQQHANLLIDTIDGAVDSIFLVAGSLSIPPAAVSHLRTIILHGHPRHRYAVIVGAKLLVPALMNVLAELIPGFTIQYRLADSRQDAYAVLEQLDYAST